MKVKKNSTDQTQPKKNPPINEEEDFVFRFDLSYVQSKGLYNDPIVEMFREQIANILDIVILMEGGKEIKVDGFKFLNNSKIIYQIFHKPD